MSKVIYEFSVSKYLTLTFEQLPTNPYNAVRIGAKTFPLVPVYDLPNSIAIESNESFIGQDVEFIMQK